MRLTAKGEQVAKQTAMTSEDDRPALLDALLEPYCGRRGPPATHPAPPHLVSATRDLLERSRALPGHSYLRRVVLSRARRDGLDALLRRIAHKELETEADFFELFVDGCQFAPLPAA
jgi:hypothetical protein